MTSIKTFVQNLVSQNVKYGNFAASDKSLERTYGKPKKYINDTYRQTKEGATRYKLEANQYFDAKGTLSATAETYWKNGKSTKEINDFTNYSLYSYDDDGKCTHIRFKNGITIYDDGNGIIDENDKVIYNKKEASVADIISGKVNFDE